MNYATELDPRFNIEWQNDCPFVTCSVELLHQYLWASGETFEIGLTW